MTRPFGIRASRVPKIRPISEQLIKQSVGSKINAIIIDPIRDDDCNNVC